MTQLPTVPRDSDERTRGGALSLSLGGGTLAPVRARAALGALQGDISPQQLALVELLISELVTNSVVHGGAGPDEKISVQITVGTHTVQGEVSDSGPGFTPGDPPEPRQIGGLGLVIVDRSAKLWGTSNGGRRVWFELDRDNDNTKPAAVQTERPNRRDDNPARTGVATTAHNALVYDTCRVTVDAMVHTGASTEQLEHTIEAFPIGQDAQSALWLWANRKPHRLSPAA